MDDLFQSIHNIQSLLNSAGKYTLISTRPRDHEDVQGILRKQGDKLDSPYILDWLNQFEQALDDSTLVAEYLSLQGGTRDK